MSDETQEDVIDEESAGSFEDVAAVYDELPEEPGGLDDTNDWQPDFTDDFDTEVDAFFELIHNLNPDEDPNWDRNSLVEDDYLGLGSLDLLLDQPGLVDPFFEEVEEFEGFERSTLDELSYSF